MLPLFTYFQELQQRGYSLGISEYKLLLTALENKQTSPESVEELLALCRHLWYKPGQNIKVFEDVFWEFFDTEQKQAIELLEEEEIRFQQTLNEPQRQTTRETSSSTSTTSEGQSRRGTTIDTHGTRTNTERRDERPAEPSTRPDEALPEDDQEFIFLNIHPRAGSSGSIALDASGPGYELQRNFSFEAAYAPLSRRELQNIWRYLPTRHVEKYDSNRLDVKATVKEIARFGEKAFFKPQFHQEYKREAGLFLLIDHLGSMVAFDAFAREVEDSARDWFRQHKKAEGIHRYFFQNIPEKHLYLNTNVSFG
jgi:uncharacterized protein with von Willebrand factor type A (vWA) domain